VLQLPLGRLFWTFQKLASFSQLLTGGRGDPSVRITDTDYQELLADAEEFCSLCAQASFTVTHESAKLVCLDLRRAISDASGTWHFEKSAFFRCETSLKQLIGCLRSEASTKAAMGLPSDKLALYAPTTLIYGPDVRAKFPSTIYDIDEAAKCLGLGRPTAAVFHVMRVVEIALKAVSRCLSLPPPANPNWGMWLNPIRDENKRRGAKWSDHQFFQDVYQRLDAIKDAQRNPTLHVATTHTEEEAFLIFKVTENFMKKLAARMDENGDPKA
jgi:hypothetical protein